MWLRGHNTPRVSDYPRFRDCQSDWVSILYLTTIQLTPTFCRKNQFISITFSSRNTRSNLSPKCIILTDFKHFVLIFSLILNPIDPPFHWFKIFLTPHFLQNLRSDWVQFFFTCWIQLPKNLMKYPTWHITEGIMRLRATCDWEGHMRLRIPHVIERATGDWEDIVWLRGHHVIEKEPYHWWHHMSFIIRLYRASWITRYQCACWIDCWSWCQQCLTVFPNHEHAAPNHLPLLLHCQTQNVWSLMLTQPDDHCSPWL